MDGTVAAYRFPYLLAGDSLVFKQDSEYYEHFYSDLKPWKHYIPFNSDLSNLVERIKWAIDHDKEAKRIAVGGQTFARNNLMPQDIFCYHVYLLNVSCSLSILSSHPDSSHRFDSRKVYQNESLLFKN